MPEARTVEVQAFLDAHPVSFFQWTTFVLCFLTVLLDGFDTAAIGYIAPSLLTEWGIPRPALAPVLSAALFGLAFGALAAGPLADRFGRKTVLLGAVLVMGVACCGSAFSGTLDELFLWRFVTGLGLGAAMPNSVTLMSEYCPTARRALLTNAMFCGFPLGAALGGFLAAWMIPLWGWRSVLVLGGLAPLLLAVLLLLLMPESVRYLVATGQPTERIRDILRRISSAAGEATSFFIAEPALQNQKSGGPEKSGVALVLSEPYLVGSVMLWLAYFMGLTIFYALINWMPVLLRDIGLNGASAALVTALFPLGGICAILFGWLMDQMEPNRVVATGFVLTAVFIYLIGQMTGSVAGLMATVFLAGTLMNTAQSSLPALAAGFYPTRGRATGVAWMLGFGRFGGIAGSFLVAELARRKLGFSEIFTVVAVPGLIAGVALVVKAFMHPTPNAAEPANRSEVVSH